MGFIISVRRSVGLGGVDDGGVASVARNLGQIELFGAVVKPEDIAPPAYEIVLDPARLPWELREDAAE